MHERSNPASEQMSNENRTSVDELGCDALLSAFDAKIADCERRAKECYEDRAEDCRTIGDYWNAARIEIARFRNELFPDNAEGMGRGEDGPNQPEN